MTVKQTQPTVKQQAAMYVMIGKQMASSYRGWAMLIAFLVGTRRRLDCAGLGALAGTVDRRQAVQSEPPISDKLT